MQQKSEITITFLLLSMICCVAIGVRMPFRHGWCNAGDSAHTEQAYDRLLRLSTWHQAAMCQAAAACVGTVLQSCTCTECVARQHSHGPVGPTRCL